MPKLKAGKETACPPKRFPDSRSAFDEGGWRRRVKFLANFAHSIAVGESALPSVVLLTRGSLLNELAIRVSCAFR